MVENQKIKLEELYGYFQLTMPPIPKDGCQFAPSMLERFDRYGKLISREMIESPIRLIRPEMTFWQRVKALFR